METQPGLLLSNLKPTIMAHGKETPRQKMIGLMYLVLMALLAMNVSKDVLNAFETVNNSLIQTEINTAIQNDLIYSEIENAYAIDPLKSKKAYEQSTTIKSETETILDIINQTQKELIAEAEELSKEQADTIHTQFLTQKDNYDIPTHFMLGVNEDGTNCKSEDLLKKITNYKSAILNLFSDNVKNTINLGLELKGGKEDGQELNWQVHNFYHTPLIATITILSKLKTDVKNAENIALNEVFGSIGKNDFSFDTIAAKVIAPTNYVLLGEEYNAEVFLAAFSTTQNPEIKVGEEDLKINNGIGEYAVKASTEGIHTYNGNIKVVKKNGEVKEYPFSSDYMVARPSLTVSPIKMNVLYAGIDNPLSVSVPGVANENLIVRSSFGSIRKTGNGTYSINPPKSHMPNTATISVSVNMPDGSTKAMGNMDFRLKRIPKPKVKIMGKTDNFLFTKMEVINIRKLLTIYSEDFAFDGKAEITSFKIAYSSPNGTITKNNTGDKLSQESIDLIKQIPRGREFYIMGIQAKGMDGSTVKLPDVVVKIKN